MKIFQKHVSIILSFSKPQPSDFEANVTVNVTTLLVLTTFFISISDALPKTSYVKAIDLWLITNLLIPFIEIILITFMNVWYKESQGEDDDKLFRVSPTNPKNKENGLQSMRGPGTGSNEKLLSMMRLVTKVGLPAFYILFCICFFVYGMLQ